MTMKLGYATGSRKKTFLLDEKIQMQASISHHALELGFVRSERLPEYETLNNITKDQLRSFDYLSLHAPCDYHTGLRYPSEEGKIIVDKIKYIVGELDVDTVLFHPDIVDDYSWLQDQFGDTLAFENMDVKKHFGTTIEDMLLVFDQAPAAKWVCDINHLYTLDKTMSLAKPFHEALGERLCHYHISAYGGFHDCFCLTHEDEIMTGIKDWSKPLIHEGSVLRDSFDLLLQEQAYLEHWYKKYLTS